MSARRRAPTRRRPPRTRVELPPVRCQKCGSLAVLAHFKVCADCARRRYDKAGGDER
jgi:hypothetical protein